MAKTLHDRLVAALLGRGERLVAGARSSRYTVLTARSRNTGTPLFHYVGRSGALRLGPNVAASTPLPERIKARLLSEAEQSS